MSNSDPLQIVVDVAWDAEDATRYASSELASTYRSGMLYLVDSIGEMITSFSKKTATANADIDGISTAAPPPQNKTKLPPSSPITKRNRAPQSRPYQCKSPVTCHTTPTRRYAGGIARTTKCNNSNATGIYCTPSPIAAQREQRIRAMLDKENIEYNIYQDKDLVTVLTPQEEEFQCSPQIVQWNRTS